MLVKKDKFLLDNKYNNDYNLLNIKSLYHINELLIDFEHIIILLNTIHTYIYIYILY